MDMKDMIRHDMARVLYDDGWRATDKAELIEWYDIDPKEAAAICELLAEIEAEP